MFLAPVSFSRLKGHPSLEGDSRAEGAETCEPQAGSAVDRPAETRVARICAIRGAGGGGNISVSFSGCWFASAKGLGSYIVKSLHKGRVVADDFYMINSFMKGAKR